MKCEDATDLIIDSLMDSLDARQARELASHIETCEACAGEAESMQAVWDGLEELGVPSERHGAAGRGRTTVDTSRTAMEIGHRIARPRRRPMAMPSQIAASIALLLLGSLGGYLARGPVPPPLPQAGSSAFLMLVRGEEPDAQIPGDVLVEEYRTWAQALAVEGRLLGGEKLTDEPGRWVSGAPVADERVRSDVSGYFVIRAPSYDEAVDLAMASPHVRYGGVFEIRQIDAVN
jgi:hypothetical protein